MTRSSLLAFTALALAFAPAAWAVNTVTRIVPEADRVVLVDGRATVRFMVSGQVADDGDCGIWIDYGDQGSPDTRVIGRSAGMFPREFEHTFARPGQFTVTARGERVKQTFGCGGQASTRVTVIEQVQGRGRGAPAVASCPDGWQLREGSFIAATGAFTCAPSYPRERIECGPGLRYFERDNLIGCRPRGRDQR